MMESLLEYLLTGTTVEDVLSNVRYIGRGSVSAGTTPGCGV